MWCWSCLWGLVELTGERTNGFTAVLYDGIAGWASSAYLIPDGEDGTSDTDLS